MEVGGKRSGNRSQSTGWCEFCLDKLEYAPVHGFCTKCEEYLCRNCFDHHTNADRTKKHVLQTQETMPRISKDQRKKQILLDICERHSDNPVEYYCEDCGNFICTACTITRHSECQQRKYIIDKVKTIKSNPEQKEFDENFAALGPLLTGCNQNIADKSAQIGQVSAKAKAAIQRNKNQAETKVRQLTDEIVKEADSLRRKDNQVNQELSHTTKQTQAMYENIRKTVTKAMGERRKIQRFIGTIRHRKIIADLQNTTNDTKQQILHKRYRKIVR